MLAIWSLVPPPFLKPAWTSGSSHFTYCWSLAWKILGITLLAWDECNCAVVWLSFGIAFNFQPITSCQIEGGKVEVVTDFFFLGSKTTEDSDCSYEIRGQLLLGRKAMTNLDNMLRSRAITLPTKVRIVEVMVFSVVTYGYESERWKRRTAKELMPSNCGAGAYSWEFLGKQGDQSSQR